MEPCYLLCITSCPYSGIVFSCCFLPAAVAHRQNIDCVVLSSMSFKRHSFCMFKFVLLPHHNFSVKPKVLAYFLFINESLTTLNLAYITE